ncbi:MAG: DUF1995 family protein [Cyanobacteria bacterium J06626_6]
MPIPTTLTEATEQAKAATQAALKAGYNRLQVEMAIPEIKHQPIAQQFLDIFEGQQFKVFFPDAGAAALARRDWNTPNFVIRGLGELTNPVDADDDSYLVVNPSSIEVETVEALCNAAIDQPVILLNPKLEDVAIVGIGYAARQIRERFLSQIESCYYLRPMESAAIYRCFPGPWQLWKETAPNEYEHFQDFDHRPSGEEIDRLLYSDPKAENPSTADAASDVATRQPKEGGRKKGLLAELQQFLRALSQ